ncbi:MAG: PD40 domain-containing protein [Polyangiaceae bacterium]|nr:PD40 domain-containing protein [Polyangiaceae bacterium]
MIGNPSSFAFVLVGLFLLGCGGGDGGDGDGGAGLGQGKLYFSYGKMQVLDMATAGLSELAYGKLPWPLQNGSLLYVTQEEKLVTGDPQGAGTNPITDCPYCDRLSVDSGESRVVHDTLGVVQGENGNWSVVRQMDGTVVGKWLHMHEPAFLSDGSVVMSSTSGGLWLSDPGLGAPVELGGLGPGASNPSGSPDGGKVAVVSQSHVWVMNQDGSEPVQLTHDENYLGAHWPTWSPDGKLIAYQHGTSDGIWVIPSSGGTAKPVLNAKGENWLAEGPMVWR